MARSKRLDDVLGGETEPEINPMDGVSNMADVMLVLVTGLLLALISFWNVDIAGSTVPVEQGEEVTQVDGMDSGSSNAFDEEGQYEEYGVVYRDPETGELYMVTGD